jgi:hypothetical protein
MDEADFICYRSGACYNNHTFILEQNREVEMENRFDIMDCNDAQVCF